MNTHSESEHAASEVWLVDGGEMSKLIRAMDWSHTPLGPIEAWPQRLRTTISICLDSRQPIAIWWGAERTMFYNDAYRPRLCKNAFSSYEPYEMAEEVEKHLLLVVARFDQVCVFTQPRPMLGQARHPQFLGRPGQACWAEIWDIIGPMMDQIIETGKATWSEDLLLLMSRFGYLEETYFTFSYSPVRDARGRPDNIFNACSESTARVLGERRLKTLREMAVEARTAHEAAQLCAEILGHNPRDVPFVLIYLLDNTGKHLRLSGYAGLAAEAPGSPLLVDMTKVDAAGWPLARVVAQGTSEIVDNLAGQFDGLPAEPWGEPARQAMVLPIASPGWSHPAGVLVLGISARRAFDDDYRRIFDLVAGHVATALSNARAYANCTAAPQNDSRNRPCIKGIPP